MRPYDSKKFCHLPGKRCFLRLKRSTCCFYLQPTAPAKTVEFKIASISANQGTHNLDKVIYNSICFPCFTHLARIHQVIVHN